MDDVMAILAEEYRLGQIIQELAQRKDSASLRFINCEGLKPNDISSVYLKLNNIISISPSSIPDNMLSGCATYSCFLTENKLTTSVVCVRADGLIVGYNDYQDTSHLNSNKIDDLHIDTKRLNTAAMVGDPAILSLINREHAAYHSRELARTLSGIPAGRLSVNTDAHLLKQANNIATLEYIRIRKASKRFIRLLDPSVLITMSVAQLYSFGCYNYLSDPKFGLYRRQAARAFPLFAHSIQSIPELSRIVDNCGILVDALSDYYEVPKPLIRRLKRVPARFVPLTEIKGAQRLEMLRRMVSDLETIPLSHVPTTRKDWISFLAIWRSSIECDYFIFRDNIKRPLYQTVHGQWADAAESVLAFSMSKNSSCLNHFDKISKIKMTVSNSKDLVDAIYTQIVLPLSIISTSKALKTSISDSRMIVDRYVCDDELRDIAFELIYNKHSIKSIMKKSYECHQTPNLFRDFIGIDAWPPLLKESIVSPNNIIIVPLCTADELYEEGLAMQHCVGSYAQKCAFEGHHIVSLRTPDDIRISTAEILKINDDKELKVRQHRAFNNDDPTAEAVAALEWLIIAVASGEVEINKDVFFDRKLSINAWEDSPTTLINGVKSAFSQWRKKLTRPWSAYTAENAISAICTMILEAGYKARIDMVVNEILSCGSNNTEIHDGSKFSDLTYDDISGLSPRCLQILLKSVNKNIFMLALKDSSETIRDLVFTNMSETASRRWRENMAQVGPIKKSECDFAKNYIAKRMAMLVKNGHILCPTYNDDEDGDTLIY